MENAPRRPFYDEYAWAFDLIINTPIDKQCAFVVEMLSQRGVNAGARILDAGCGIGGHSIELARLGYVVRGLDLSSQLITEAQRRISDESLPISFAVGDILSLEATHDFDAILCRGVLNDLLDEASRLKVFFSFARALRPDGVLILDVREWNETARRKTLEPVFEKTIETTRGQLSFRSRTRLEHPTRRLCVAEQHTLRKESVETVSTYEFTMQCWTQEELNRRLARAGFEAIEFFGDYDRTVQLGASDRLVCVASLEGY
jgi:SAM-dependent methyltransferase